MNPLCRRPAPPPYRLFSLPCPVCWRPAQEWHPGKYVRHADGWCCALGATTDSRLLPARRPEPEQVAA